MPRTTKNNEKEFRGALKQTQACVKKNCERESSARDAAGFIPAEHRKKVAQCAAQKCKPHVVAMQKAQCASERDDCRRGKKEVAKCTTKKCKAEMKSWQKLSCDAEKEECKVGTTKFITNHAWRM